MAAFYLTEMEGWGCLLINLQPLFTEKWTPLPLNFKKCLSLKFTVYFVWFALFGYMVQLFPTRCCSYGTGYRVLKRTKSFLDLSPSSFSRNLRKYLMFCFGTTCRIWSGLYSWLSAQELFLVLLRGPNGMSGIEPGLAEYKYSKLPTHCTLAPIPDIGVNRGAAWPYRWTRGFIYPRFVFYSLNPYPLLLQKSLQQVFVVKQ